jgi:DNA-binding NarL/FixJ family response regulator
MHPMENGRGPPDELIRRLIAALETTAALHRQTADLLRTVAEGRRVQERHLSAARSVELAGAAERLAREARRNLDRLRHVNATGDLTKRETSVVSLIVLGLRDKDIATRLEVSRRTAESHVANIFHKLGVHSRAQVVAWYLRRHPEH